MFLIAIRIVVVDVGIVVVVIVDIRIVLQKDKGLPIRLPFLLPVVGGGPHFISMTVVS